jgi:hypothetical protein
VTDPYSRGLSADGVRSMFVDLDTNSSLFPDDWHAHRSPEIHGAEENPLLLNDDSDSLLCVALLSFRCSRPDPLPSHDHSRKNGHCN